MIRQELDNLWHSILSLGVPAAVTVREEIYQSRRKEFDRRDIFSYCSLSDWSSKLMTEFLERFAERRTGAPPVTFKKFRGIVARNLYKEHYGDIPCRPWFLGMLAEDAWQGSDPEKQLFRLYGKYFRNKLERDWRSQIEVGKIVRAPQLASRYGLEEAAEALIRMMQALTLKVGDGPVADRSMSTFTEKQFRTVVAGSLGYVARIEDILLISLIQPTGRNPETRVRLFRFAHQSFFDWFLARGLVESKRSFELQHHSTTTQSFGAAMLEAIRRGEPMP